MRDRRRVQVPCSLGDLVACASYAGCLRTGAHRARVGGARPHGRRVGGRRQVRVHLHGRLIIRRMVRGRARLRRAVDGSAPWWRRRTVHRRGYRPRPRTVHRRRSAHNRCCTIHGCCGRRCTHKRRACQSRCSTTHNLRASISRCSTISGWRWAVRSRRRPRCVRWSIAVIHPWVRGQSKRVRTGEEPGVSKNTTAWNEACK
jgi:hypothetical protein